MFIICMLIHVLLNADAFTLLTQVRLLFKTLLHSESDLALQQLAVKLSISKIPLSLASGCIQILR